RHAGISGGQPIDRLHRDPDDSGDLARGEVVLRENDVPAPANVGKGGPLVFSRPPRDGVHGPRRSCSSLRASCSTETGSKRRLRMPSSLRTEGSLPSSAHRRTVASLLWSRRATIDVLIGVSAIATSEEHSKGGLHAKQVFTVYTPSGVC